MVASKDSKTDLIILNEAESTEKTKQQELSQQFQGERDQVKDQLEQLEQLRAEHALLQLKVLSNFVISNNFQVLTSAMRHFDIQVFFPLFSLNGKFEVNFCYT